MLRRIEKRVDELMTWAGEQERKEYMIDRTTPGVEVITCEGVEITRDEYEQQVRENDITIIVGLTE